MSKFIHISTHKLISINLLLITLLNLYIFNINAHASSLDFSVNVEPAIKLDIPTNLVSLNLTPSTSGAFSSQNLSINVSTNYPTGYRLYMNSGSTNLTQTAPQQTATIPTLPEKSGGYSEADFTNNRWGYKLPSTNYLSFNGNAEIMSNSSTTNQDSTTITFATKVDTEQLAGLYEMTLNFIAIPFYQSPTINDIHYMQDFRYLPDTEKNNLINQMPEGEQYQLTDARDGNKYWVSKLADGNVWMTQNLDFIIDTTKTYTHEDTDLGYTINDINETWQPGETLSTIGTIPNYTDMATVQNFQLSQYYPAQAEAGDNYVVYDSQSQSSTIYHSLDSCIESGRTKNECEHYHVGNYYNWNTAVATNDSSAYITQYYSMPNSICPAGWKLPQGLTKNGDTVIKTDYNTLFNLSGIATGEDLVSGQRIPWTSNGKNLYSNAPYYFTWTGQIAKDQGLKLVELGIMSRYWETSVMDKNRVFYLHAKFGEPGPAPAGIMERGLRAFQIRCLLR